jgi:hypothetical protein
MPSVDIDRSRAGRPYPANVGELLYQPLKATPSRSAPSVQGHTALERDRVKVRLVFDRRVIEGKRLMEKDAAELGHVSLDLVNEVRAKWPG